MLDAFILLSYFVTVFNIVSCAKHATLFMNRKEAKIST